jgi:hypothetical protein
VPTEPELLPPGSNGITPFNSPTSTVRTAWLHSTPMQKAAVFLLSGGFVCSVLMFALGQFFQIRGVQHMLTSRIFLGIAWICAFLLLWGIGRTLAPARWLLIAVIGGIVLLIAAIVLDHVFPMPNTTHHEAPAATTEQRQASSPTAGEIAEAIVKEFPALQTKNGAGVKVNKATPTKRYDSPRALSTAMQWVNGLKDPPTMKDLFISGDYLNTMRLHDDAIGIQWNDNGTVTHIERQLYLDFPANAKFVGFYVPSIDPTDTTRTAEACMKLAQADAVRQVLEDLPKKTFIAADLGQTATIQDLTFSGRVLIYYNDFLSINQRADIIRAFGEKKYVVRFSGPEDFGKVLSRWHDVHKEKSN